MSCTGFAFRLPPEIEPTGIVHFRIYFYNFNNLCLFQASSTVELGNLPNPYPLPYGEDLGEVEAVHLILAHDLYNELREIVGALQELTLTGGSTGANRELLAIGCSSLSRERGLKYTASSSHLRTMLPESSSRLLPAKQPNHAT